MKTPTRSSKPSDINVLWKVLPHPPSSVVRLFARRRDHREGDFARSAREVRHFAETYADHNVYVAPNPTQATGGSRHSAADVTHWSYLLIDMDPVCTCDPEIRKKSSKITRCATCRGKAQPLLAVEEALLWLGEWVGRDFGGKRGNRPIIIDSGRGVQAWIRLEDVLLDDVTPSKTIHATANDDNHPAIGRSIARRVNGYWLKKLDEKLGLIHNCRIDTSVSDLPRLMRCPGTVNQKTKRTAGFIHATDHVFKGLATLLVTGTPKKEIEDPEPTEGVAAGQPWQMVFAHLTRMAQVYLTEGQEESRRHKVMWHTAKKLRELGVSRPEARRALAYANSLKGEKEELEVEHITHALDTAYSS